MSDIKIIECETTGQLMDMVKAKRKYREEVGYVKGNLIAFVSEDFSTEIERCIGNVDNTQHQYPEELTDEDVYYAGYLYGVDVYGKKGLRNGVIQILDPSIKNNHVSF